MKETAKHFKKRDAILNCLQQTDRHPSAEWIYDQLKSEYSDVSLATVYRNLALFKKQGLIASLGTVDGVERFDGNTAPHVHYICTHCGSILDMHGINVPETLCKNAADLCGGQVDTCQLTFTGICQECLSTINSSVKEIPT